jgi:5-methylcytosine-specific restriction endonuclease McrA
MPEWRCDMPSRARKHCSRCGQAFTGTSCRTCHDRRLQTWEARRVIREETEQPSGRSPYAASYWQAFSRAFLAAHPTCEYPRHARLPVWQRPPSAIVDHKDGLGPNGPRGLDPANCWALCRSCHAIKSNKHDGSFGNPVRRMTGG